MLWTTYLGISAATVFKLLFSVVLGYGVRRWMAFADQSEKGLSFITLRVLLPCMLFGNLTADVSLDLLAEYFWAVIMSLVPMLLGFLFSRLCCRVVAEEWQPLMILGGTFQNGLVFPLSVVTSIRGIEWLDDVRVARCQQYVFLYNLTCALGLWSMGSPFIKYSKQKLVSKQEAAAQEAYYTAREAALRAEAEALRNAAAAAARMEASAAFASAAASGSGQGGARGGDDDDAGGKQSGSRHVGGGASATPSSSTFPSSSSTAAVAARVLQASSTITTANSSGVSQGRLGGYHADGTSSDEDDDDDSESEAADAVAALGVGGLNAYAAQLASPAAASGSSDRTSASAISGGARLVTWGTPPAAAASSAASASLPPPTPSGSTTTAGAAPVASGSVVAAAAPLPAASRATHNLHYYRPPKSKARPIAVSKFDEWKQSADKGGERGGSSSDDDDDDDDNRRKERSGGGRVGSSPRGKQHDHKRAVSPSAQARQEKQRTQQRQEDNTAVAVVVVPSNTETDAAHASKASQALQFYRPAGASVATKAAKGAARSSKATGAGGAPVITAAPLPRTADVLLTSTPNDIENIFYRGQPSAQRAAEEFFTFEPVDNDDDNNGVVGSVASSSSHAQRQWQQRFSVLGGGQFHSQRDGGGGEGSKASNDNNNNNNNNNNNGGDDGVGGIPDYFARAREPLPRLDDVTLRDRDRPMAFKMRQVWDFIVFAAQTPPVYITFIAIVISLTPPLRWCAETPAGSAFISGVALIGTNCVPLQLLVMGIILAHKYTDEERNNSYFYYAQFLLKKLNEHTKDFVVEKVLLLENNHTDDAGSGGAAVAAANGSVSPQSPRGSATTAARVTASGVHIVKVQSSEPSSPSTAILSKPGRRGKTATSSAAGAAVAAAISPGAALNTQLFQTAPPLPVFDTLTIDTGGERRDIRLDIPASPAAGDSGGSAFGSSYSPMSPPLPLSSLRAAAAAAGEGGSPTTTRLAAAAAARMRARQAAETAAAAAAAAEHERAMHSIQDDLDQRLRSIERGYWESISSPTRFTVLTILLRLLLVPAISFLLVHVLLLAGVMPSDRTFVVSILIGISSPAAVNACLVTTMMDFHPREFSEMMFYMYALASLTSTMWLAISISYASHFPDSFHRDDVM